MSSLLLALLSITWPLGNLIRFEIARNIFITPLDVTVLLITTFAVLLRRSKLRNYKSPFTILFIVFLLSLLVNYQKATLFSVAYFCRFFLYLSLFWSLRVCFTCRDAIYGVFTKILMFWSLAAAAISLILFVLFPDTRILLFAGWDEHYYRLIGPWLDPNFTGGILVLVLLFCIAMKQRNNAAIVAFALFLTFSRSSWLAFFAAFLFLILRSGKACFVLKLNHYLIIILSIVLFFFILSNLQFLISNFHFSEGQNLLRMASIQGRLDSYKQGFFIFLQNPVLGIGFNNYPRFGSHVAAPDSSLLFVLATTGVIGFMVFVYCLRWFWLRIGLIGRISLIGILVHSLFVNSLFYPPVLVWFAVLYNIENANNRRSPSSQ